jgi:iron transport multicopper oxidase
VDAGLKAYKAVPDASGNLVRINLPPTNGLNKFQRPAFGNGRLYVSDSDGNVICLGSPVSLPLNCSSPKDFGQVSLGSTSTRIVTCTALIPITSIAGVVMSDPTWQASNASLPEGALTPGQQFSFPVTWNLTSASIENARNASFGSVSPGVKSGSATVRTNNGVADYSSSLPISLTGVQVSSKPFLQTSPQEVDFGGVVVNGTGSQSGIDSSFIITNAGNMTLTITGYAYTPDFDPPVEYTNTSAAPGGGTTIGDHFISSSLPPVGTTVDPGQSLTVPVTFKADEVGNYYNIFQVWSNGGTSYVLLTGSATTAAIGSIAVSTSENGWDPNLVMDFGRVKAGTTVTRRIRICNNGGSSLLITKSKPPIQSELRAQNPTGDLYEGQFIPPNECAYAAVDIAAAPATVNTPDHTVSDVWVLNTNDVEFGAREVKISAVIYTPQVGPLLTNGTSRYRYLGCYYDVSLFRSISCSESVAHGKWEG